jgi:hypothetical protein
MFSSNAPHADAQAGTIVVLIDESTRMAAPIAGGTRSKAEGVATAVNSMLNQLTAGPDVRVAIVGYGGGADGVATAQIRWTGPLDGRGLVNSSELAAAPAAIEQRVRRIPGAGGVGIARQETIQFPVWYVPQKSGVGGFAEAAEFVRQTLVEAANDASGKPPMIIHVCGEMPIAAELQSESTRTVLRPSFSCHLHLGASDRIPATLYPTSNLHLVQGDIAALFDASSVLPDSMIGTLRTAQVAVAAGARGVVYQAHMGDLIRFLMLAKAYATTGPEAFPPVESPPATVVGEPATVRGPADFPCQADPDSDAASETWDRVALVVIADRSQADPASGAWLRRQEQVNDILGKIAKRSGGDVDASLVVYGDTAVQTEFTGPLQGKAFVPDVELADGALRVERVTGKVSNGIGGLVEFTRSQPIFLDCEPTAPALNLEPAMAAVADAIRHARQAHEGERVLPIVMHVTGGAFSAETITDAAEALADTGDALLYHSVVPEQLQRTAVYPADARQITDPATAALWQMTSPLAGAEMIAAKRSTITDASRGFVVGAKFDLLVDSIQSLLTTPEP